MLNNDSNAKVLVHSGNINTVKDYSNKFYNKRELQKVAANNVNLKNAKRLYIIVDPNSQEVIQEQGLRTDGKLQFFVGKDNIADVAVALMVDEFDVYSISKSEYINYCWDNTYDTISDYTFYLNGDHIPARCLRYEGTYRIEIKSEDDNQKEPGTNEMNKDMQPHYIVTDPTMPLIDIVLDESGDHEFIYGQTQYVSQDPQVFKKILRCHNYDFEQAILEDVYLPLEVLAEYYQGKYNDEEEIEQRKMYTELSDAEIVTLFKEGEIGKLLAEEPQVIDEEDNTKLVELIRVIESSDLFNLMSGHSKEVVVNKLLEAISD